MSKERKCLAEKDGFCTNVWLAGTRCDGYREKCKLRPSYNRLQETVKRAQCTLRKAFGVDDD